MAYIYRYQLGKKIYRDYYDLRENAIEIKDVLTKFFEDNIKEIVVEEKYFEFRTYTKIGNKKLQDMGRLLKDAKDSNIECGFIRKEIEYYAHITFNENEGYIKAELIEFNDIENSLSLLDEEQVNKTMIISSLDMATLIYETEYLDESSKKIVKNINNEVFELDNWYVVSGKSKNKEDHKSNLEIDLTNYNYENGELEGDNLILDDISDEGFSVYKIFEIPDSKKKQIKKLFGLDDISVKGCDSTILNQANLVKAKNLVIYNVGQGLSCSICDNNLTPVIYFDLGRGTRRNKQTTPTGLKFDFSNSPLMILSHVDDDHWASMREFPDSLNMKWIVPDQQPPVLLVKKYCILSLKNNLFMLEDKCETLNVGVINSFVIFNASGPSNLHPHNNGLNVFLELNDNTRILLPGDNRYEYIENGYKENLNILCASHHGGVYTIDRTDIKVPAADNKIIYSYGRNNSFGHPSKDVEYGIKGWNTEHRTINGDYIYGF
ncbi:hypothetical protein [Clostridium beijerinckii]|uniref:hypothetical protein n=1 Tax=Clostridium beijerinckii TaxID=1520 RepID=UPI00242BAD85|nr:hypothetical protein [Clostridium beijerinckii]MDG5855369.1 hypothetical protein [Clostridium beijerinckii]